MSSRIWKYVCIYLLSFQLDQSKAIEEKRAYAEFIYQRGQLLFQDEFDTFDTNIWEVCNRSIISYHHSTIDITKRKIDFSIEIVLLIASYLGFKKWKQRV